LAERLIPSEAIDLAGRMLRGFPNKDKLTAGYAGAMAEILMSYPKAVATACADPIHGVVRGLKFMPVPADVIAWCENRQRPILEEADREVRVKRQTHETDAWLNLKVPESLKAKGKAWLDRTDPVAQEVSGQKPKVVTKEQREAYLASAKQAGRDLRGMTLRPETLATLQKHQLMPTAKEIPGPYASKPAPAAASQDPEEVAVDFGV
jgi:hypothetical protein